jgi:DNA-binding transcriptional MerR regulator
VRDPLTDIGQYSQTLSISQAVKFCEKKELAITRAMIQNYIRIGLLPPPVNKRQYTHKHLAALVMIDYLKAVFDIADIQAALTPLMDAEGLPLSVYEDLLARMDGAAENWNNHMEPLFYTQGNKALMLDHLALMAHTAELKALALEGLSIKKAVSQ